jgi:hypothetical protein
MLLIKDLDNLHSNLLIKAVKYGAMNETVSVTLWTKIQRKYSLYKTNDGGHCIKDKCLT